METDGRAMNSCRREMMVDYGDTRLEVSRVTGLTECGVVGSGMW